MRRGLGGGRIKGSFKGSLGPRLGTGSRLQSRRPLQGAGLACTGRLLCAGFVLNSNDPARPPGAHLLPLFWRAVRGPEGRSDLSHPRSLTRQWQEGRCAQAWRTQSPCSFPGPCRRDVGTCASGERGLQTSVVGRVTEPNGAEATLRSADVKHFPVEHRLALGRGSE